MPTLDLSFRNFVHDLCDRVLAGAEVAREEAIRLLSARGPDSFDLFAAANRVRDQFQGQDVHLCSIVNAKSGRCSEDCGFCAQSARFETGVPEYDLLDASSIRQHALAAKERGAQALGIVTAWRGLKKGRSLDLILERLREINTVPGLHADASLGIIDDPEIPALLKAAGLHTYNHNLESSRRFYPQVCSTHDYDERLRTIRLMKDAGVRICSGGIFNMGEEPEDRVDLALELRALDVDIVPMNFLNPMDGTPMGSRTLMPPMEALRTIAMFRFVLPRKEIMVAGGREVNLGQLQSLMFIAGASATMAGHYLTSTGRATADDWDLIEALEMDFLPPGTVHPSRAADTRARTWSPDVGLPGPEAPTLPSSPGSRRLAVFAGGQGGAAVE